VVLNWSCERIVARRSIAGSATGLFTSSPGSSRKFALPFGVGQTRRRGGMSRWKPLGFRMRSEKSL
jgi:hypothetical protein